MKISRSDVKGTGARYDYSEEEIFFVLRRAFRSMKRSVKRSDVTAAFDGMADDRRSGLLNTAVALFPELLRRDGYSVIPYSNAPVPSCATARDLLDSLEAGRCSFRHTGLTEDELPVNSWRLVERDPKDDETMMEIVRAMSGHCAVRLEYVGLKRGARPESRMVAPISLDRMGDQWRLVAQDVQKPGHPIRTFVLARILSAKIDPHALPKNFIRAHSMDSLQVVSARMNILYEPEQRAVLEREFRVKEGRIEIPRRCVHEFLIRYADGKSNDGVVWPPLEVKRTSER